jgi:radical SAM superfamily enzyme YgiQ (UPF0313 family)
MDIGLAGRLAEELRRKCPRALLVVGGAHSSAAPADTLARFGAFDAAAFGEGEETFLAVCQAVQTGRSLAGIAGVAYREASGGITVNPARPLMPDLSRLGKPAWDLLPPGKAYFVAVSRGCPFDCSFCFRLFGKTVRPRPVDDIIEEVEGLIERAHPEEFQISGATFGIPRDHAMALLDRMIERDFGARVRWRAMTRVNVVDREMLRKLKRSGCYSLSFGIESGDDRILADTGKGINVRLSRDAVKMAKEEGLATWGFFIFGHPGEDRDSIKRTVELAVKLNTDFISIGIMVPWPGTRVAELAARGEAGYVLHSMDVAGCHKHFGKRVMEFEGVSLQYMNLMKLKAYVLLYVANGRFLDLLRFGKRYSREGMEFLTREILSNLLRFSKMSARG